MVVSSRWLPVFLLLQIVFAGHNTQCPTPVQNGCMPLARAFKTLHLTDPAACCAACALSSKCTAFTLNQKLGKCFLHPTPSTITGGDCISGVLDPAPPPPPAPKGVKSVLMIIVDDLRPEIRGLGFNQTEMITPNIDRLLSRGVASLPAVKCILLTALCLCCSSAARDSRQSSSSASAAFGCRALG